MVSKLIFLFLITGIAILILYLNNKAMPSQTYSFLALGDSYTIGEGVALYESFPYQTIQQLRTAGYDFYSPEILARTGWTSDDLRKMIRSTYLQKSYRFVSLLIGVNDQYQGKDINRYAANFEQLLKQAITLAAGKADHVFVLSIPDWSVTPFAAGSERMHVAREIDQFNAINESIAGNYNVCYIEVTAMTRADGEAENMLARDQLHPSGAAYAKWANLLAGEIQKRLL